MPSQQVPTDFAMDIEYFENDAPSEEVVVALLRDGAAVVRDQVRGNVADAELAELRPYFDKEGLGVYQGDPDGHWRVG